MRNLKRVYKQKNFKKNYKQKDQNLKQLLKKTSKQKQKLLKPCKNTRYLTDNQTNLLQKYKTQSLRLIFTKKPIYKNYKTLMKEFILWQKTSKNSLIN